MNLKKFISGISAFAIAASAFAGLAVTASAENPTETATLKQMKTWSANTPANTTDVSTTKIHAGVGPSSNSSNYPGIAAVQFTFNNTDSLTVSKATFTFDATVPGSNRTLSAYTASNATYDFSEVPLLSSSDGANDGIYTQTALGTKWNYSNILGTLTSVYAGTGLSGTTPVTVDVTDYITAQAENKMATFAFSNANAGADITNTVLTIEYASADAVEKDITINYVYGDDSTAIPAASLPTTAVTSDTAYSGSSYTAEYPTTFDAVEDGVTYRYTYAGAEGADTITVSADDDNVVNLAYTRTALQYVDVTVNAVDSANNTVLKNIVSENVLDGTVTSYAYSKYLTDDSDKVTYSCDLSTYSGSVTATATGSNTVTVPYTAYNGTAYFSEAENGTWSSTTAANGSLLSGNTGTRVIANPSAAFTIGAAGKYTITVPTFCRNTRNSSVVSVYKNSISDDNLIVSEDAIGKSQKAPLVVEKTDVELAAGDTIIVTGTVGETLVDYVLAVKTADITTPATAAITHVQDFTSETDADTEASLWNLLVTAGTDDITSVDVKVDGQSSEGAITGTTVIASGSNATFGIVINKLQKDITSIKAVVNSVELD